MDEKEHFKTLSKGEKRYLSRFGCAWCDHPLHYLGCSAVYGPCDEQTKIDRRKRCLEGYKPRKPNNPKPKR